jgi:predicted HAD superfamily Cof-like phosphohydrolase
MGLREAVLELKDFHRVMDVPIIDIPKLPPHDRRALRLKLINEEVNEELIPALERNDIIEIADGIADAIYVLIGCALEYGIPLEQIWDAVHHSNMKKADGPVRDDGKRLKPAGWRPPPILDILRANGYGF